jgi:hypothetical protein
LAAKTVVLVLGLGGTCAAKEAGMEGMLKNKLIAVLGVALSFTVSGCWLFPFSGSGSSSGSSDYDYGYSEPDYYGDYDASLEGEFVVRDSTLVGDLGNVRSFSVAPGDVSGYRTGWGEVSVTVEATLETGEQVMAIVYFEDGVLAQPLEETHTYVPYSATYDEPYIDVTGCSASTSGGGSLDFDVPAEQVDVTLEPSANEGMQRFHFVATFDSEHGPQQAEGSFEIPAETGTTAP